MTEGHKTKKTDQVEEKIRSAADDLREAAKESPDRSGDLHLQASAVDRLADSTRVTLEDERPVGRSGQGIERPHAECGEQRAPRRPADGKAGKGDKT